MILLDTHAALFLHAGELELFTSPTLTLLETEMLSISPMVLLEMDYLKEIGRINFDSRQILKDMKRDLEINVASNGWLEIILQASSLTWTRDPFDRIIAAQALYLETPLLTKDRAILDNCSRAFW